MSRGMGWRHLEAADLGDLAPRVRETDRLDCALHGCNTGVALLDGLVKGPAWAVTWEDRVIGALGWTRDGCIWSLWQDLTEDMSRALMAETRWAVTYLAKQAGERGVGPLGNTVRADNRLTIAWLKASKCFQFKEEPVEHDGHSFLHFLVKPLGDL